MPATRSLILGPVLRHIGGTDATVWVECDGACEVEILGRTTPTFQVERRHYAIVAIEGLEPAASYEYEVRLDGDVAWPEAGSELPPSTIRTLDPNRPLTLVWGSCRASAPHEPPWTRKRASDPRGLGIDALRALAMRAARAARSELPDALLMLGDQIYADQPSPRILDFTRSHRPRSGAPSEQLEDFTEYAVAYCDAWTDPYIRWLLSTVPSSMIFDDHEIHDEWKISQAWVDEMRAHDWYDRRVTAGLMTYWLYQHLGNLSPAELAGNELLRRVREADDGGAILRDYARGADRQTNGSRWSYRRDFGRTRLVVFDTRGGRELTPGDRRIVDRGEWQWLERELSGDYDHLLLASSIPFLVDHGLHMLEAWSERICDGAWGGRAAKLGERFRQKANLGHWAAFQRSFHEFAELLEALAAGRLRRAPRSIAMLSGDVHHCYLAEVGFPRGSGVRTPVWQAVCSGLRKQLDPREKTAMKLASSRAGRVVAGALARAAGVGRPPLGWRLLERPLYANQVATLRVEPDAVGLRIETTASADWRDPRLETAFEHHLLDRGVGPPEPEAPHGDRPAPGVSVGAESDR